MAWMRMKELTASCWSKGWVISLSKQQWDIISAQLYGWNYSLIFCILCLIPSIQHQSLNQDLLIHLEQEILGSPWCHKGCFNYMVITWDGTWKYVTLPDSSEIQVILLVLFSSLQDTGKNKGKGITFKRRNGFYELEQFYIQFILSSFSIFIELFPSPHLKKLLL